MTVKVFGRAIAMGGVVSGRQRRRRSLGVRMVGWAAWALSWLGGGGLASAQFVRIDTIVGDGGTVAPRDGAEPLTASLANPFGIQQAADGGLVIASFDWDLVFRVDAARQRLERVAGTGQRGRQGDEGASALTIQMNQPHELQLDDRGNIYVADTMNHRVGLIRADTGGWEVVAGTGHAGFGGDGGPARQAALNQAYSIALEDQQLLIVDLKNQRLRRVDLTSGVIETLCGTGENRLPEHGQLAAGQPLADPRSIAMDRDNIWIVLRGGHSVWRLDRRDQRIYHVAGTGQKGFSGDGGDARLATFNGPKGIAVEPGKYLYVADTENHAIRQIDLKQGTIRTVVGSSTGQRGFNGDGDNLSERWLNRPHGICLLKSGDLLIGDSENHRVRQVRRELP